MDNLETLYTVLSIFAFVLGSMIGSFLNVCVYRLPKNLSVVKPRSRCPKCEKEIAWYDNIPVISWIALGARCRNCSAPISWQYPLVEALTGFLFFLVFWRFGISGATPVYMLLTASLVLVTFVDLTDWTIPNEVTFPGVPIGLGCAVATMFYPTSGLHIEGPFDPVINSLIGIMAGGGSLYLLDKLTLVLLKKRSMGFGDVKLLAMLGAFFGLYGVMFTFFVACIVGSFIGVAVVIMQRRSGEAVQGGHYLPFGPYLCLGGFVYMLYGPELIRAYWSFLLGPASDVTVLTY